VICDRVLHVITCKIISGVVLPPPPLSASIGVALPRLVVDPLPLYSSPNGTLHKTRTLVRFSLVAFILSISCYHLLSFYNLFHKSIVSRCPLRLSSPGSEFARAEKGYHLQSHIVTSRNSCGMPMIYLDLSTTVSFQVH
jgi:hypothetical protein